MIHRVAALLLAAGSSRRMGQSKQLLPLDGKPIIRHCIDTIIAADIDEIIVVLGHDNEELLKTLRGLPVKAMFNEEPGSDMAQSVRIGLRAVNPYASGVLVSLSDHPLISEETLRNLLRFHADAPDKIIIPVYKEKRGHPTLFPRHVIDEIFEGGTLKDLINRDSERIRTVGVIDEGVIIDIDTMQDYERVVLIIGRGGSKCKTP
jgi:molybdenum cofactor cytidylyltransferase